VKFLETRLDFIQEAGLTRSLTNRTESIDLCSNDYLGIARGADFGQYFYARLDSLDQVGATGSRLLSGNNPALDQLEDKIAQFHNAEAALVLPTGYQTNLALLSTIATRHDTIIRDELCHASIIDGMRMSQAKTFSFKHNDLNDLRQKISKRLGQTFVVVEALYSMDGDVANLNGLIDLCREFDARLIVDEAHSVGLYGENGAGRVQEMGLEDDVFARVLTYGKAFGYQGGAIVGSKLLKQYLVNKSRPVIFSTGMSAHQVLGISVAYDLVYKANTARKALRNNIDYLYKTLSAIEGLKLTNTSANQTPLQAIIIPGNEEVMSMAQRLQEADMFVLPIRKPTVAEGSERLRICVHAYNTTQEIDLLAKILTP
jgi:8-amino-7-oxononanoate synthase